MADCVEVRVTSSDEEDDGDISTSSSVDAGEPVSKKRREENRKKGRNVQRRYNQHYRKDWENDKELKDWLAPVKGNPKIAFCKYCKCTQKAHKKGLLAHGKSPKHKKNVEATQNPSNETPTITEHLPAVRNEIKILELRMAAFIGEHASFRAVDHLTELFKTVSAKCLILKDLRLRRTKCTRLILRVLGPGFRKEVVDLVCTSKYSLIIDESNDVSTIPMLAIVIRFISKERQKLITTFYRLLALEGKDAESITASITAALAEDGLDVRNLVGIGTDGASVMLGTISGVYARLKEVQPDLVIIRCICHSLNLAASDACSTLPRHLENLIRETYNWFSNSSKRQMKYAKIYDELTGRIPKKILKLAPTRWLSRFQCLDVIVSQWDQLQELFNRTRLDERCYDAEMLYGMFADNGNKAYCVFLLDILEEFAKINESFQLENGNVLKLIQDLRDFYERLIRRMVSPRFDVHPRSQLMAFDFERHIRHISTVNFGLDFGEVIRHLPDERQVEIKRRCLSFLVEAAKQVRERMPESLESLCLLENLSPDIVIAGRAANIAQLLSAFPSLVSNRSAACRELDFIATKTWPHLSDPVRFWLDVLADKDTAGNSRFSNIGNFAIALFSLPYSNASVERVFSVVNCVKTKLRNRMHCETVESVLSLRYGLSMCGEHCAKFLPSQDMFKSFTSHIYLDDQDDNDEDVEDACLAVEFGRVSGLLSVFIEAKVLIDTVVRCAAIVIRECSKK